MIVARHPEGLRNFLVFDRRLQRHALGELIDEYGAESAADIMLIDVAMIGYFQTLRINGWIGNLQGQVESEAFGTIFVVTNLDNGKKIRCPVQDRGPFARGRVLDFSLGAARQIGCDGLCRVTVRRAGYE